MNKQEALNAAMRLQCGTTLDQPYFRRPTSELEAALQTAEIAELLFLAALPKRLASMDAFRHQVLLRMPKGDEGSIRYLYERYQRTFSDASRRPIDDHLRDEIARRDGHCCTYCCGDCTAQLDVHHVVPRAKGGNDTLPNLVAACPKCNRSVGSEVVLPRNWWRRHPESRFRVP